MMICSANPPAQHFIKFRTSHREDIRYLKTLGVIRPESTDPNPRPDSAARILSAVESLKSRGFSDAEIPRLAALAPDLFSPNESDRPAVDDVLSFLAGELGASPEASRRMVLRCPALIFSDVEHCLRPTLEYLRRIGLGIDSLSSPTNLNAHLLNTRVGELERKVRFLTRAPAGLTREEAERVCGRAPAIFGYGIEGNLRPKIEYLVWEMGKGSEELLGFPQYFGFSLANRIAPRHLHLRIRNLTLPLNRMLLWSDQKFYAKWK